MDKVRTAIAYVFFFVAGTLMSFLFPLFANAANTAHVTFDVSADPTDKTVVLVSEISNDYSASYGQISEPGANTVDIGNIKASTQYYFVAYRLTATGERSIYSEEYPYLTPVNPDPVVYDLPPIEVSGTVLNISITVD